MCAPEGNNFGKAQLCEMCIFEEGVHSEAKIRMQMEVAKTLISLQSERKQSARKKSDN